MASSSTYADCIAKTLTETSFLLYFRCYLLLALKPARFTQQQLNQEVLDSRSVPKGSVTNGNSRAEAVERSMFKIRRSLKTP